MGGWPGEGGEIAAVGGRFMDLSHRGQSRDAEGRHPAARPGLGPWVGAQVPGAPGLPYPPPRPLQGIGDNDHLTIRGSVSRRARQPDLPGTARQDQEEVEGPPRGGGLSVRCGDRRTVSLFIISLYIRNKEDGSRRDRGQLRPPICPATFLKSFLRALQGAPSEVPRGTDRGDRSNLRYGQFGGRAPGTIRSRRQA